MVGLRKFDMTKKMHLLRNISLFFLAFISISTQAQNNALILNGAYINISNGTWTNPVYLVVNNGQPAAIQRNSGHIISESEGNYVQWNTANVAVTTNYIVPFGYSNTDYLPVTLHKNSMGVDNSSALVLSTWATPTNNTPWATNVTTMAGLAGSNPVNSVIDRWWQVIGGTNVNASFDVTYRGAENTIATPIAPISGQHWDIPATQWLSPTGSGTGVIAGTGTVTNITMMSHGSGISSPYVLSASNSPLPIELVSFTAACANKQMEIKWVNATETNVMNIELQKSSDMNIWTTIYTAAPSNQSTLTHYDFVYNEQATGNIYYRLKVNNNDGVSELSHIVSTQTCDSNSDVLTAFYFDHTINVHSHFSAAALIQYSLFDLQGKKVMQGELHVSEGDQAAQLTIHELSNAIYIFNATSNDLTFNKKLLISDK